MVDQYYHYDSPRPGQVDQYFHLSARIVLLFLAKVQHSLCVYLYRLLITRPESCENFEIPWLLMAGRYTMLIPMCSD